MCIRDSINSPVLVGGARVFGPKPRDYWFCLLYTSDPFNAVIITEATGKIEFESVVENVTYKVESDEATGCLLYTSG